MSITLDGSGGLFTRLGKLIACARTVNGARGSTAPNPSSAWGSGGPTIFDIQTAVDAIALEFDSDPLQNVVDGIYTELTGYRKAQSGFLSKLQAFSKSNVLAQVNADTPQSNKTSLVLALTELIRQMTAGTETVNAPAVSATASAASGNTGNGTAAVSVKGPNGVNRFASFAEQVVVQATSDSQLGSTLGQEPFSVIGEQAESDPLSQDWPAGSGASTSVTALDPAQNSVLDNSSFDSFAVTDTPDGWTVNVGTPSTDIFASGSSAAYGGVGNALKYTGTGGGPLTEIYQAVSLKPNTVYLGAIVLKKSSGLAAGVLQLDLHNGSSVVADDAGTNNAKTVTLSGLTTSYAFTTFCFITPKLLPATLRFRIKATTALTSGESAFIDHLTFAEAKEAYVGGPWISVFSGSSKFVKGDRFNIAVSNDNGGIFVEWFERLFGMRVLGLQLPGNSAGGETILDSLCL